MRELQNLLCGLNETDVNWLLSEGEEETIITNTCVIKEGGPVERIYFVLQGLLRVHVSVVSDRPLKVIGPGGMVGEMALLDDKPASASVYAAENSLLLGVPYGKIKAALSSDSEFAARFFKALAVVLSTRMRDTVGVLGGRLSEKWRTHAVTAPAWKQTFAALREFKLAVQKADQDAIQNDGCVLAQSAASVKAAFSVLVDHAGRELAEAGEQTDVVKEELGRLLQAELLPYLMMTENAERMYSKPRGYAGDYLTIAKIYENRPAGAGRIGALLDECFLETPQAKAVRNRRGLLAEEILATCKRGAAGETTRVTSLACGPAAEVFDAIEKVEDRSSLLFSLVDIDMQALAYVSDRVEKLHLRKQVKPMWGNLIYLVTGRQQLELRDQDLVYSVGLIDYFADAPVTMLMNYIYDILKPGGRVILGNFHPRNPHRYLLEYLLDWKLIHRTEEDMSRLFCESKFQRPCTKVRLESEGVNLFAECVKDSIGL